MGRPKHYAKPDLSRLASRKMNLSAKRLDLDWAFHEWMAFLQQLGPDRFHLRIAGKPIDHSEHRRAKRTVKPVQCPMKK